MCCAGYCAERCAEHCTIYVTLFRNETLCLKAYLHIERFRNYLILPYKINYNNLMVRCFMPYIRAYIGLISYAYI